MEYIHSYFIADNYKKISVDSKKNNNISLLQEQEKNNFSLFNIFENEKYSQIFQTEGLPLDEEEDTINDRHLFNSLNKKCPNQGTKRKIFSITKSNKFSLFTETEILKYQKNIYLKKDPTHIKLMKFIIFQ